MDGIERWDVGSEGGGVKENSCCLAHQPGRMGYQMLRQGALEEKQLCGRREDEVTEVNCPCHRTTCR